MKTKTLQLRKSTCRSPLRLAFLLIALALGGFVFSPMARAQLPSPPPDGGYRNGNTAEGDGALFSLTSGDNKATGASALFSNTTGNDNTATGVNALFFNNGSFNTANGHAALFNNTSG